MGVVDEWDGRQVYVYKSDDCWVTIGAVLIAVFVYGIYRHQT
ncbi:MAG: hypothetical protein WC525_09455 [Candidatus Thermoplasmatota archaeon]